MYLKLLDVEEKIVVAMYYHIESAKNSFGTGFGNNGFLNVRMGFNDGCLEKDDITFGVHLYNWKIINELDN